MEHYLPITSLQCLLQLAAPSSSEKHSFSKIIKKGLYQLKHFTSGAYVIQYYAFLFIASSNLFCGKDAYNKSILPNKFLWYSELIQTNLHLANLYRYVSEI